MDPTALPPLLAALGLTGYLPLAQALLALIGAASVLATFYPPTAPGARYVHLFALLRGNATPAVKPGAAGPPPVAGIVCAVLAASVLSACSPAQMANVRTAYAKDLPAGQLFCARAVNAVPAIIAIADLAGVPVLATGAASDVVRGLCAAIGGLPVSPPADLGQAVLVIPALLR